MNRHEFNQLCASEFRFLADHGFTRQCLDGESASIVYEKGDFVFELNWEDFGYYITACIVREELASDTNWISVNGLIKVTSPQMHRPDARGPAELFGHEALVRYYAQGLALGLETLLQDTETTWQQCLLTDKQEAERELFLTDETDKNDEVV